MLNQLRRFFSVRTNRNSFLFVVFLAGLFFSKSVLSISVGLFSIHWLADSQLKNKLKLLWKDKAIMAFLIIFLLHLVGLIYTSDFFYAFKDIKTKIPFLVLPLVVATEPKLNVTQFKAVLYSLYLFALTSAAVSLGIYLTGEITTLRNITPFMSHIRFSLLTTLAACFLLYDYFNSQSKASWLPLLKLFFGISLIVFTVTIIASFNGILLLGAALVFMIVSAIFSVRIILYRWILSGVIVVLVSIPALFVMDVHKTLFPPEISLSVVHEATTENGNIYKCRPDLPVYENGMPVTMYFCDLELKKEWNKRSTLPYDSFALNGFPVREVLMRYLTSAGYTKDSAGVWMLSEQDILEIEKGTTNVLLSGGSPLKFRVYEFFNGYYNYKRTGNPNDNSLFLRFEFWKTAVAIIARYPLFGVGTGDVNIAFKNQYEVMNSPLEERWRVRSHNQFLSVGVAFGIPGIILFAFALIFPFFLRKRYDNVYFTTVFIVLLLSMLTEDTIETQVGASLFAFFYCFFLFYPEANLQKEKHSDEVQPMK
jgi:hypothetical protein